jgi:hypothetical protein
MATDGGIDSRREGISTFRFLSVQAPDQPSIELDMKTLRCQGKAKVGPWWCGSLMMAEKQWIRAAVKKVASSAETLGK